MRYYGVFFILFLVLAGCGDEPASDAPTDFSSMSPEQVSKAWQRAIDINDFETAKALSTDKTREFVASIEKLIGDDPTLETVDTTIFVSMECSETSVEAKCIYSFNLEGELLTDSFFLVRINNQWLIDIQEEAFLNEEETEDILNELNSSEDNFFD